MQAGQCQAYSACEGEHCQAGQAGCADREGETPGGTACQAGAEFSLDRQAVHWDCVDPWDEAGAHIDIYGTEDIPSGTICVTVHRYVASSQCLYSTFVYSSF